MVTISVSIMRVYVYIYFNVYCIASKLIYHRRGKAPKFFRSSQYLCVRILGNHQLDLQFRIRILVFQTIKRYDR